MGLGAASIGRSRKTGTIGWLEDFIVDLRRAARGFFHSRGFSLVATATIGLAIGVITAVFTPVDAVLFKTLPLPHAERLVFINVASDNGDLHVTPPYPGFERFHGASSFTGMAAFRADRPAVVIDGRRERAIVQLASVSFFDVLRVPAVLGRTLSPGDERLDPAAAVLGYEYWQRRFNGSPDVLGRTIGYKDGFVTIVGVSAREFTGPQAGQTVDVTLSITLAGRTTLTPTRWWLDAVGRLKDGVSRDAAAAELDPIFQTFMRDTEASADMRKEFARIALTPAVYGLGDLREEYAQPLVVLLAIAALVLLIACANILNLLLARALARRREFGVRTALGASRGRLVRQLLTESLVLGFAGTVLGVFIAYWLVAAMTAGLGGDGSLWTDLDLSPDRRIVGFAILLCLGTSLLVGLAPAIRAARGETVADLKPSAAPRVARRFGFARGTGLVVAQMALSLILLVATTLLVGTLARLRAVDVGFHQQGLVNFDVVFAPSDRLPQNWSRAIDVVSALPGVQSTSVSWIVPLGQRDRMVQMRVVGAPPPAPRRGGVVLNHVSGDYFKTMGIPLRGRAFTTADAAPAPAVVILNEAAVRANFGKSDPIGQRVQLLKVPHEVVGVIADSKHVSLRDRTPGVAYVPVLQPLEPLTSLLLAVRTSGDVAGLADSARRELLASFGSEILVGRVTTMAEQIERSLTRERLLATLSGGFGLLGLFLAIVGLLGVLSFQVVQRRREIAVRLVLGAQPSEIRWRILRTALLIAGVGVIIAAPVSLMGVRALGSLLFGVQPLHVPIVVGCAAALVGIAALAGWLPALRASRLEPAAILRDE